MRIVLCNEVVRELPFERQCALVAALGYDGVEIAPFTLSDEPHRLDPGTRAMLRRSLTDHGLVVTSFHWLLLRPDGLSVTSPDPSVRARTVEVMDGLAHLCAELGGKLLVHGSPAQRRLEPGGEKDGINWATECFHAAARSAERAGVLWCVEPLAPPEANFITTVAEAARLVDTINSPAFRTMLDTAAAGAGEEETVVELLDRWLPTGKLAHVHLNDRNRRGPGEGADRFAPVLAALRRHDYAGDVAVEPFIYHPDGPTVAARAIGYLRGILEALP